VGAQLFPHTDAQTDGRTERRRDTMKLIGATRNFANTPKNTQPIDNCNYFQKRTTKRQEKVYWTKFISDRWNKNNKLWYKRREEGRARERGRQRERESKLL